MKKEKSTSKIPPAGRLSVVYFPVEKIKKYSKNARTHSAEQVAQIAASISEFGFTNPLLIDEAGSLIAGHGRLEAALSLGMADVPTIMLTGLSENQRRAYVLADNKIALNAGWDEELLHAELESLRDLDFNLELLGWDEDELSEIFDAEPAGQSTENLTPSIPTNPTSAPGDLWILGDHRLLCGDSTKAEDIARLMQDDQADMIFTDPPYGMSYGGGRAAGSTAKGATVKAHGMIMNDDLQGDALIKLVQDAMHLAKTYSKKQAAFYTCFTWRTYAQFEAALASAGIETKNCIVWDKKSIGLGNGHYRPQHEFIFYSGGQWHGDKSQSDVWCMSRGATGNYVHPTQKPVELIERAIDNSSKKGAIILDVFGGSGSTIIACEKRKRASRLMELDPKYCDVIVQRWENFTGRKAHEDATGLTFEEKSKK